MPRLRWISKTLGIHQVLGGAHWVAEVAKLAPFFQSVHSRQPLPELGGSALEGNQKEVLNVLLVSWSEELSYLNLLRLERLFLLL